MKQYFVLDMGGTFVKYALMNENKEILEQGKFPSVLSDMDSFLASLDEHIRPFLGRFEGIAVSMPGRIDTANGIAYNGGAFVFFVDSPFEKILEERYGVPATIANDGKCAAEAEATSGALKDVGSGAVVIIGTGIGGGIVLDHKVWMGSQDAAGEFSYLISDYERFIHSSFTDFSSFRCAWTAGSSATALIREYAARKQKDPSEFDGVKFFEAYDEGDPDAAATLEHFGQYTASGIFAIQAVLDLERIAIGGGISARKEVTDVIRDSLEKKFDMPFIPFRKPEVVRCVYGSGANLIGALEFHLNR